MSLVQKIIIAAKGEGLSESDLMLEGVQNAMTSCERERGTPTKIGFEMRYALRGEVTEIIYHFKYTIREKGKPGSIHESQGLVYQNK
ncbi:hypothetical protein K8R33_01600 [archaeon]|nr:hypothetical protein [archaeon]